jgi:hypothetical protein
MVSQARQLLSDDHQAVDVVLKQLLTSLDQKALPASHGKLDLLWARLAVHIRAEHLHLFPAVINCLTKSPHIAQPGLSEAHVIVENLRRDHEYFMRELARVIGLVRELPTRIESAKDQATLTAVRDSVLEIENRLVNHNEIEENQVYRWASTILTEPEQIDLARRINAELENRPPRFPVEAWANAL